MAGFFSKKSAISIIALWLLACMGISLLFGASGLKEAFSDTATAWESENEPHGYNQYGYSSAQMQERETWPGTPVPLKGGEMFLFSQNKVAPECCAMGSTYSSSDGCVCVPPAQMQYLATRGGNRSTGDF